MKILLYFGHPAHVHLFKNYIWEMEKKGHNFVFTHSDKDLTFSLLKTYGFDSREISKNKKSVVKKGIKHLKSFQEIYRLSISQRPDLLVGVAAGFLSQVGKILGIPSLILDDTEKSIEPIFYKYFADTILTPHSFQSNLGSKQKKYKGIHEISYLHPEYYKPDKRILQILDISENEAYVLERLVSNNSALHDFFIDSSKFFFLWMW